ncbi:hypothetical protein Dtox_0936 [Desulfofarcimen acetoxidans DSM 771]|uniref:Uncharacterized protein n=2 Tax=Desulfofarcimen acetoxidans TaxID=58138 RepID=C8W362_DESAS|nr:hypothetical protein Dtox_0936 [Desulfofarcimen acetoxidans DSM 771]
MDNIELAERFCNGEIALNDDELDAAAGGNALIGIILQFIILYLDIFVFIRHS